MKRPAWLPAALVFLALLGCPPPGAQPGHERVFDERNVLRASADGLRATVVTAHLAEPMLSGWNVLWCSSFQLAWNEACALLNEDIRLEGNPPLVRHLNRKAATKADIDPESYLALAGWIGEGILKRIPRALEKKFKGEAAPRLDLRRRPEQRDQDFVAYAYLFKHLEFATPFERLTGPLSFRGEPVSSFGLVGPKRGSEAMRRQVLILDYEDQADFIIELRTKSEKDRLILARVRPGETLEATIAHVRARIHDASPVEMGPADVLRVPKMNFDITREYRELLRRVLKVKNPKVLPGTFILIAKQNIRFQMDEKGVRLRSEAVMAGGCAAVGPRPEHYLVFDSPFLLILLRADAKTPYLALWVDNAELLARAE